ncbi:SH3 domain-containing protein [Gemmatimonas sp.]|uniref:BatD family protein n=1 Tax=Gemmatimonas sp. TaxID=1962908 RepID=UPI003F70FFB1
MPRVIASVIAFVVATFLASKVVTAQPSPTAIVERIRSTGNKPIDFHAAVFPDTVFVGQQITYQVAVLLSDQARSRLRRNPEFLPPELRGLLAYELGSPTRVAPRSYGGGLAYEAHVFQRGLFGVAAGALKVPAPMLTYSLPQSASYFSREERYVVRAESAQIVIKPLPVEGRPADFTGAVGVLRASARFDDNRNAAAVRVGDPLVLTVRIEGTGNMKLLPRPALELSWATVVPGGERVQVDTTGSLVRGAKEFDFILTPSQEGAATLPVIRYAYFDPYRAAYAYAQTAPADVRISEGDLASAGTGEQGDVLPLRPWRRVDARTISQFSTGVIAALLVVLALAPLPALFALFRRLRRKGMPASHTAHVGVAREAPADDDSPAGVARRTRRSLLAQLATRLHVVPTELVTRTDLERVLRRRGVTRSTTSALLQLLDDLAMEGFGGDAARADATAGARASALMAKVQDEAVPHGRTKLWARRASRAGTTLLVGLVAAAAAAPVGAAGAQSVPELASVSCDEQRANASASLQMTVQEAAAAYEGHRFSRAAQQFAGAAERCPFDVDLLLNWGTAAWATNDTVSAVIAWQRAARLEPLAADVQERLALLPAGARGGLADVPLVPVLALTGVAVFAWLAAWVLYFVLWRRAERGGTMALTATLLLCIAVAAGGTAWWGHRALDASGLGVVRRPETLRTAPGFEAGTSGGVATGDVVRLASAQEGWVRIEHTDGRSGWIPVSRIAPLVVGTTIR